MSIYNSVIAWLRASQNKYSQQTGYYPSIVYMGPTTLASVVEMGVDERCVTLGFLDSNSEAAGSDVMVMGMKVYLIASLKDGEFLFSTKEVIPAAVKSYSMKDGNGVRRIRR